MVEAPETILATDDGVFSVDAETLALAKLLHKQIEVTGEAENPFLRFKYLNVGATAVDGTAREVPMPVTAYCGLEHDYIDYTDTIFSGFTTGGDIVNLRRHTKEYGNSQTQKSYLITLFNIETGVEERIEDADVMPLSWQEESNGVTKFNYGPNRPIIEMKLTARLPSFEFMDNGQAQPLASLYILEATIGAITEGRLVLPVKTETATVELAAA